MEPSSSTSTSPIPADLRRSKRKKFHLDVVAACGHISNKKSKTTDPLTVDVDDKPNLSLSTPEAETSPSEATEPATSPQEVKEEFGVGKRKRRSNVQYKDFGFNVYQDNDDEDMRGFFGDFQCKKCPARYESKAGLNNHSKLHSDVKRKFDCELCDFSAHTLKACNQHLKVHKALGVVSAPNSPNIAPLEAKAPDLVAEREMSEENVRENSCSPLPPVLMPEISTNNEEENLQNEEPAVESSPHSKPDVLQQELKQKKRKSKLSNSDHVEELKNMKVVLTETHLHEKKCPHCPFKGKSVNRLMRHLRGHELASGFICPAKNCTYKCATAGFLKRHYSLHREHLPWPPVYVSGSRNEEKINKRKSFRPMAQIKSCLKTEEGKMKCNIDECEYVAHTKYEYIFHKVKVHKAAAAFPKTPFVCLHCGHRALSHAKLRVHKLIKHNVRKPRHIRVFYLKELIGDVFFCRYLLGEKKVAPVEEIKADLDESFDSLADSSMDTSEERIFQCALCPYRAISANRVERHTAKHYVEHEFKCKICQYSCRSQEMMTQHDRLHEEAQLPEVKDEPVEQVEEKEEAEEESKIEVKAETPIVSSLTQHSGIMKWVREKRKFKEYSDDSFIKITMNNQKGFQCIDCPYTSKYRGDIRTHKVRHTSMTEFRCIQCTYSAQRPVSLRDHIKQHVTANLKNENVRVMKLVLNGQHAGERRGYGKQKTYHCRYCPYVGASIGCLWRHFRHHKKVPQIHVCSACTYSSTEKYRMDDHVIVHSGNGVQHTFVRRVNKEGVPIPMITDLSYGQSILAVSNSPASSTVSNEDTKPKKERPLSNRGTPQKQPSPPVTNRPLSERTTRNKNNFLIMISSQNTSRTGSRVSTPIQSSSNLAALAQETAVVKNETPEEIELSHFAIRQYLKKERKTEQLLECPDCPFKEGNITLFRMHRDMHFNQGGKKRQYACCECSFSVYTAAALQEHLKLHTPEGFDLGITSLFRRRGYMKKAEVIPPGVRYIQCTNCSFKTVSDALFLDHRWEHVRQLSQRLSVVMKRSTPKDDYQRPKLKSIAANRVLKCCSKCFFRCTSQYTFVAHSDRHGWNRLYKCKMCDYSDSTKNIVDFHETHHHVSRDHTLTDTQESLKYSLINGYVSTPPSSEFGSASPLECMKVSGSALKCSSCEYVAHLAQELSFHINQCHRDEPGAKEASSYLQMGMMPPIRSS